jgi:nitrile hydratase accessory protein
VSIDPVVGDASAPAAPPRSNGELVFSEPWESRAFGLAVALHDAEVVDFEAFRARLIDEIGDWEAAEGTTGEGYRYYERWLVALERTLIEHGLVVDAQLDAARETVERAWAHDHADHGH